MVYIELRITEHVPGKYEVFDWECGKRVLIEDNASIPQHYLYNDDGRFDIYNLAIWGRGAFCCETHTTLLHYEVTTEKSVFDLVDYINMTEPNHMETPEYFSCWWADRRGEAYYLHIHIDVIGRELVCASIAIVEDCFEEHAAYEKKEKIEWPASLYQKPEEWTKNEIETSEVIRFEKNYPQLRQRRDVNWEIPPPEFEGGGSEAAQIWINGFLSAISFGISAYQLAHLLVEKHTNEIEASLVENARSAVTMRSDLKGYLSGPDNTECFDAEGNRVFVFHEAYCSSFIGCFFEFDPQQ